MRCCILAFAAGVWALQSGSGLPGGLALFLLLAAAAGLAAACAVRGAAPAVMAACMVAAAAAAGFAWAGALAHARLADRLLPELEGRDVVVTGVIAGLPQPLERGVRFDFDVESAPAGIPRRVLLSWYNGLSVEEHQELMPVRAGERWRYTVRLRRPHGHANPHGFDYEAWLLERGVRATGYVVPRGGPERLAELVHAPAYWIERLREVVRERFWDALPQHRHAGILVALAIGDQRAIEAQEWDVFARTGTSHLMSISGLHVTMVSGLAAWLMLSAWRRSARLVLALPAQKAAAAAGFVAALAYCAISGFAVPAQRTLYMVGTVALALWLGRLSSPSRILALALGTVLVIDPWAVLSAGFWLSFGAVAVILYVARPREAAPRWLTQWGRVQWAVTVALAPLLLLLFQQVSIVSPLANAVAIPVVSLAATPLALLGAVQPFEAPLYAGHFLLEWLMAFLEALSALDGAVWQQHAPRTWAVCLAALGAAWLMLPRGFPGRAVGLVLFVPLFAAAPAAPRGGEAWLTVLDVGQGLAAVVRTSRHVLLYDAGPRFGDHADTGSRVVVPYLRGEGVRRVDAMVLSHEDNDHAGGAASVLRALDVGLVWSSLSSEEAALERARLRLPCAAGRSWTWDGVRFTFLHPGPEAAQAAFGPTNERSCVLRVETAHGVLLLTGDIEVRSEALLLALQRERLKADVLLVPHHGSTTSSSPAFVRQVAARYAIIPVGYRNRFGHPREAVLERYREAQSTVLRTDHGGAVTVRMGGDGMQAVVHRQAARRYWQDM